MSKVNVIIPTKERPDLLWDCVRSLGRHARHDLREWDFYVIDTAAEPDSKTEEVVKRWEATTKARVAYERCPGGSFAVAINAGIDMAGPNPQTILLNNDVLFAENTLARLACYDAGDVVQPMLMYPTNLVQSAGIGFDMSGNPYNLWQNAPVEHPAVNVRRIRSALSMACISAPTWLLKEEPLDDELVNAYEDVDWCLRMRERGVCMWYEPSVRLCHLSEQSPGRHDKVQESWAYFRQKWISNGRICEALGVYPFEMQR